MKNILNYPKICLESLQLDFLTLERLKLSLNFLMVHFHLYDKAPVEYQLQLIELQSREGLKTFHRENTLPLFYKKLHSLKNEFNQIPNLSRKLLCMWGSTYSCEQFFSSMKNIKTAERNRLTDRHLANILRIKNASFDANIENIMAGRQSQKSH